MFPTTHPMKYTFQKEGGTHEGCILAVVLSLESLFLRPIMCTFPMSGESGISLVMGPYDDKSDWNGKFAGRWQPRPSDPVWPYWEESTEKAIATCITDWLIERRAKSKPDTPTSRKSGGLRHLSVLQSLLSRKHNLPTSGQHPSQVGLLDSFNADQHQDQEDPNNNDGESLESTSMVHEPNSPANNNVEEPKSENTEVEKEKETPKKEELTANELEAVTRSFQRALQNCDPQSGSIRVMVYLAYSENSVETVRKAYLTAFNGSEAHEEARSSSGPSGGDTQ
ncbi:hypothetical protein TREMEDRAFT_66071 [Tremella mesenterica DSM 1558]|uniref:uncharacterized protein n=1 Tax=Tremella mesenterica (strain ATCC 24925 / CBS 8224 / DSM 1558 / NBRC 9311 / NRRL Y-6157 / RJB 2259-6 / UBC 559-6) TaxID=578456 RepID=UPI00032C2A00|nr:uncharacterized protein TREMEDRAFT_66071 [Tremella mesenterica DSM 1558]EIW65982.1 hypothetical protein TREMEDRAFT_66071 [Tremella mesenterica DSM 1558]